MDVPEPSPPLPPPPTPAPTPARRFSRRTLFRLAAGGAVVGVSAEAARVLAGSNEHTVIPRKVYRSAQLTQEKLARVIAEKKIRTVINLRGCCPDMDWYMGDARATHAAGISQEDLTLSAKRFPHPGEMRRLVEIFDRTDFPVLIHCARGADRTGLASAVAILLLTKSGVAAAKRQLWPRYGHFAIGRTAVLDEFFGYYETWLAARGKAHEPDLFREWVREVYCPGPYRAELAVVSPVPLAVPAGRGFVVTVRATNRSVEPWTFVPGGSGGVRLRYTLYTKAGEFVFRGHAGLFARTVRPGESVELAAGFPPVARPGPHMLHADLLDAQPIDLLDTDFAQYGSDPLIAELKVG
jgi:Tyrosine phosphatase family